MEIIKNDDITLKVISKATEARSPRSEINIKEGKLRLVINGINLEACFKYDEYYLVFTTNGCPFEESLNIYLLREEGKIIDSATAFWPYNTGSFTLLGIAEPNLVQFSFFNGKNWQIKIFKDRRLCVPFFSEPSGIWRKVKFSRYFGVSEIPS